MRSLLVLAACSFLLATVLTPLFRNLARRLGLLDRPDGGRKTHSCPVPRVGGVPIALAYVGAFAILFCLPAGSAAMIHSHMPLVWSVSSSALVVFLTGLLDDVIGLTPVEKLIGQVAAGGLAWSAGVAIRFVAGYSIESWWSLPVTLLWLIGCANAFNLIDGVDGLAAGVGLFAVLTIFIAGLLENNVALAVATVPLAGALLGFLRYNFNPATIFLGDSGSLTIGFLLGCFGVIWSQKSATMLGMTAPLMALSVPLLDTLLAVVRRLLSGQPLFAADRGHIHHRLLERGLSPRRVALVLYGVCGAAAALSLLHTVAHNRLAGLVVLVFCAGAWIGVQHLGYVELEVARRVISRRNYLRVLRAQLSLQKLERVLSGNEPLEDCWERVRNACREMGYDDVFLFRAGERRDLLDEPDGQSWYALVPLSSGAAVRLVAGGGPQPAVAVAPLAATLRRGLSSRLGSAAAACAIPGPPALSKTASR